MTKLRRRITSLIVGGVLGLSLIAPMGQFNAYAAPQNVTDEAVYEISDTADGELGDSSAADGNYIKTEEDSLKGGPDFVIEGADPNFNQFLDKAVTINPGEKVDTDTAETVECTYIYKEEYKFETKR